MAQFDLLLIQNVSAAGTEYSERLVNLVKGGLLSSNASGVPTVLPVGTNGYHLVVDSTEDTGLKWVAIEAGHTQHTDTGTTNNTFTVDSDGTTGKIILDADNAGGNYSTTLQNQTQAADIVLTLPSITGVLALVSQLHTQNTDTGTTSTIFELDNDGFKIELTAESASKFGVKVDGGATYADMQVKNLTANSIALQSGTIANAPSNSTDITNKGYVDGILAANDAMVFRGTVGTGGTYEITAFNALATYNAGWTFKAITAGTIKGKVCEIGDTLYATVDRSGSGQLDADWVVVQTNIDGAVIGPASAGNGYLVLFDGTTGKLIKAGTGAPGSMAYANTTDYVAKALFDANTILTANTDNTPAALTVAEQTLIGRKTGGSIAALTPAEIMGVICVTAPASKAATGVAGQIAFDDNYIYRCTATNTWKRSAMATNWP